LVWGSLHDNLKIYGVFRTEIRIQALDFLLRYPDFLSAELMNLLEENSSFDRNEVKITIENIYQNREPEIRVEEMEKFFHGAYESIDEVIAYLVSVGFIQHDSKKRTDGKTYDKNYFITKSCADKIDSNLKKIPSVKWYFDRCELIKKYFNQFSGTDLKTRQYRYSEYSNISYKTHIQNVNDRVRQKFAKIFNEQLK
ncbi:hypothetical protein, partial [Leeuwenhoekiella blandensis]|uniref:hypothetical protein n=3 Tax=Leeuwenhoekiella blandensis TaxID=360293 RepID=UPI002353AF6A